MNQLENNQQNQDIDLLDYLGVLSKRRKMIFRNVIVVMFLVLLISFILPKTYTARTTILPPEETQRSSLLTTLSEKTPLSNLLLAESRTTSDLFVEIVKSRSVLDSVLQKKYPLHQKKKTKSSTLLEILDFQSLEKARKYLRKKLHCEASDEGMIAIEIELNDPTLAANVARAFVEFLDKINKEKSTSRAKNSRVYIENQLKLTEQKLEKASDELVRFREQHKAISLEEQTQQAIKEAGEIKGRIIAKEVELGVALQTMKPDNVVIVRLKKELEELNKQYDYLQYGNGADQEKSKEFYIPFSDVPDISAKLVRLVREVKIQETVWELLNQQYYQAKIQEARDTPTVQVLDEAIPPETRTKPKRKLLILIWGFLAFIFSVFWAFVAEFVDNLKAQDSTSYQKLSGIADNFKTDWQTIKSKLTNFKTKRRKSSGADD